ncbi:hypothetical protein I350_05931 [Cryptococcus amylolentus CBS 6273]|uniref:Autophagy-related protein 9 n=1 Tax=Cryptococcus amylolentus CBS 6273 TaxID=1296118 RepID=A0A1E3JR03_9TREE|nr:hypothetical protein I350_05931 [Cryptococcus amylolentus CBS 6273]
MLLRELQGDPPHATSDLEEAEESQSRPPSHILELEGQGSGSTPRVSLSRRSPTHILDDGSDDDDGGNPPQSLILGDQGVQRARDHRDVSRDTEVTDTKKGGSMPLPEAYSDSRGHPLPSSSSNQHLARPTSTGPFVEASGSSRSTSFGDGAESLSINASGPDTKASSMGAPHIGLPASGRGIQRPLFREVTLPQPSSPQRPSWPGSPSQRVNGYLDPNIPPPLTSKSKGKGKERVRNKGGRRYQSVGTEDLEDGNRRKTPKSGLDEYEKALWKWVNVEDLDGFLQEVYEYYKGKGIYCIALSRVLNLLTTFFVIAFSTFLISCIDYSKLASGDDTVNRLDDVLVGQCLTRGSFTHMLFIVILSVFFIFQAVSFALSLPRLLEMYRFYTHLLRIPDADIQTLPWPEIVRLVGEIRKHNPITSISNGQASALADMIGDNTTGAVKKLDAHDVANRILRQENYLIALFNKDLLDLKVRIPVPHALDNMFPSTLLTTSADPTLPEYLNAPRRKYLSFGANHLTKALEWNLRFCLLGYLFDWRGQVRKEFVREKRRQDLVQGLRRRLVFMGILNGLFAPFIIVYLLMYSFFRYFEEYHKNPSSIGSRQYTPYAQWKFREFNELPHLFERRLDRSYVTAKEYVDQFPKEKTALLMRFVAFVAGSFAAVLLAATLLNPDLFLHFEITPRRTVLFFLGVFGSVLAVARSMVPEENMVFDPEASLKEVVKWTHYLPEEWRGRLHSEKAKFGKLFALKITIFFDELLSVILTPFVLFFSLPPCASEIIDFFREFTVHVDGVGYVCSFAVFDFSRQGNVDLEAEDLHRPETGADRMGLQAQNTIPSAPLSPRLSNRGQGNRTRDRSSNEIKMEKSFLHFRATHPDWQPSDPNPSVFLDKLAHIRNRHLSPGASAPMGAGPGGSFYAGGRGLGIDGSVMGDMDEAQLRAKSQAYERAWTRSSNLHQQAVPSPSNVRGRAIEEGVEQGGDSIEGWTQGHQALSGSVEAEEDASPWRDEGVVGMLQQVLGR